MEETENSGKKFTAKVEILLIIGASIFTYFSYLYNYAFDRADASEFFGFSKYLGLQVQEYAKNVLSGQFFAKMPQFFVIAAWLVIGALAYGVYYFFTSAYTAIYDVVIIDIVKHKSADIDERIEISSTRRFILHLFLIIVFFILFMLSWLLPLTVAISLSGLITFVSQSSLTFWAIVGVVILLGLNLEYLVYLLLVREFTNEEVEEEHTPIELEE